MIRVGAHPVALGRRALRSLTASLLLGLLAGPAAAAGLSLGWLDCRAGGGSGAGNLNYPCPDVGLFDQLLFPGLVLAAPVDSVISVELVIDVDVADVALPPWWHMEPGGCRAGGWTADAQTASACVDPWDGTGVADVQGWLPGQPGGSDRHGRLLIAAATAPGTLAAFAADTSYSLARARLRPANPSGCVGCTTPACLVFNSVIIRRLPGSSVEEVFISGPEQPGLERVVWQGGTGADCDAVPVRRSTWGAVKSLYR
jgi:hypothetical protein